MGQAARHRWRSSSGSGGSQNGFVRSYALSLLGGAALVVLALLVVNLA